MSKIQAIQADITTLKVDAIVNAANTTLLGGGGVDGAIHAAAGRRLLEECQTLGGCETGDAKITRGYDLPAKYVIHTVGPVWSGGVYGEADLLRRCYQRSMELAEQYKLATIALPSISTGVYGYPIRQAAEIAVQTVQQYLNEHDFDIEVTFCCFSEDDLQVYEDVLG